MLVLSKGQNHLRGRADIAAGANLTFSGSDRPGKARVTNDDSQVA